MRTARNAITGSVLTEKCFVLSPAGADGAFSFDLSDKVDWDYGDNLWVRQYLNANGCVTITQHSPELVVIRPAATASPAN